LIDTVYLISSKYFSTNNNHDIEIKYSILNVFFKFYERFLDSFESNKEVYNHNIIYDVCFLQYIYQKFQAQVNNSISDHISSKNLIEEFLNSYKGDLSINVENFNTLIEERISYNHNDSISESFVYEFFFSDEKTFYTKQQLSSKKGVLISISQDNNVEKLSHQSEEKTKEKYKDYFISFRKNKNEFNQAQISTIEKNRLKSLTSFKLLSLKMEENFLSIKDETTSKIKQDKTKSTVSPNSTNIKNENSGYLGFLGNVIQNNNQSISSLISKFTNFNK
jgi:hypothetical protein